MIRSSNLNLVIAFAILISGILLSLTIVVHAQTTATTSTEPQSSSVGITFPVAGLGNCASKDACRDYCNSPANMPACITFAKAHGLMNKDEADRADKFRGRLQTGGGPGGCKTPQECQSFCSSVNNIETCTAFAKEQGIKDENTDHGEKISAYLKAGGQMPGGCTSKESCEAYCGNFSHAQECFDFAGKAGLTQVKGAVSGKAEGRFEGGIPPGQYQKFLEIIKKGETPGACKSKDECENYCRDQVHHEECIAFAEKVGFIEHDQADMIRKSGSNGPGGCNSPESCRAYCADQMHHEECYKFAEEHGFLKKDEVERAQQGFVTLREGLEHASPEVTACLKSVLGENVISDIQSGTLVPGSEIGDRVRGCFERFGQKGNPTEIFNKAPSEVSACVKGKIGNDVYGKISSGQAEPTPEMGDSFRICFQQFEIQKRANFGAQQPGQTGPGGFGEQPAIQNFLKSAPPGVMGCLRTKLGDDFAKLKSGEIQPTQDLTGKMKECFAEFRPPEVKFNPERRGFERKIEGGPGNLPPQVLECAKSVLGEDVFEKLQKGEISTSDIKEKVQPCIEKFRGNSGPQTPQPSLGQPGVAGGLPSQVLDCARATLGDDVVAKIKSGELSTADFKEKLQPCLEKFRSVSPQPAQPFQTQPFPIPPIQIQPFIGEKPVGTACIQVITPALDPATGVCKQFPTPCDVPAGWIKGCS